jgi:ankyrin repeat protein
VTGFAKLPGEKRKQRKSNRPALPDEAVDVVGRGDLKELRRMIADGTVPHVDAYDNKGRTLLHLSVMQGNLAMVQLLCSCKADVLCKSVDDSSVLTVAEDCSRKTVARFLGLWAHVAACGPSTALHLTALQGNTVDMQHILRDTKVDIDYEETYGHHTALHLAVKGGQFECVKILVRAGADPNRRHRLSAESALISAVIQHDALLVKFLLSQGAIAQTQYSGKTLMQWAIDNKRSSKVLDLLRESANYEYFEENENDTAGDRDGGTRGRGGVARGEGIVHRGRHEMSQGQLGQEQHSRSYLEDQVRLI